MSYKPFCNTEIEFTNRKEMEQRLLSLDLINIVVVMSKSSAIRWNMEEYVNLLQTKCNTIDGTLTWINVISPNPTQQDIINALQQIGDKKIDTIIAFGGGSSIDLAKGISAFYNTNRNNEYTIDDITSSIRNNEYRDGSFIDIIAIPSTAGTGSELTQWATIWDERKTGKFSIEAPGLKPKIAFIVPEFTISMPAIITISTGLDAMCHAIESYWSKYTTPIVQDIAYRAIQIGIHSLRKAVEKPYDISIRENLSRASVLAGLAFSQTRTTACHSISYPLTNQYGIPHGLAASITLDAVSKINKGHFINDNELYALFEKYGGIMNWMNIVCENVIDMRLSAFGINKNDIPIIVDNAFTSGRMDNNPIELSWIDVKKILESVI